jgi:hypothetical protein
VTEEGTKLDAAWMKDAIATAEKDILADKAWRLSGPNEVKAATELVRDLVLSDGFTEFLTGPGYDRMTEDLQVSMRLTEFD